MRGPMPVTLPHTPGHDVAGTVYALGEGVDGIEVGAAVLFVRGDAGQLSRLHAQAAEGAVHGKVIVVVPPAA
jgi:NADPH:quinone reductase-like Zn-dependent oxidoreductase